MAAFPRPTRPVPLATPSRERRVRVALVGAGRRARSQLAPAIFQNSALHLRAVWSRTQESAMQFNLEVAGRSLEVFHADDGLQVLLERSDIEGFVVALPAAVQAPYVERILRLRRHVLSEAPVALDGKSAQDALKVFEESNTGSLVWFISSPLRYEPVFLPSSMRLDSIGPIFAGELYAVLVVDPARALEDPPRSAESLFIESGVQYIAVLQQLFGNVIEVNCIQLSKSSTLSNTDDIDESASSASATSFWKDALSGVVRFESGSACTLNWQTAEREEDRRFRLYLWGARGAVTVELEAGSQAASAGIAKYIMKRSLACDGATGQQQPHTSVSVASGYERQLEAWRCALCASGGSNGSASSATAGPLEPVGRDPASERDRAPAYAIVDLIVLGAMLQSRGSTLKITRADS